MLSVATTTHRGALRLGVSLSCCLSLYATGCCKKRTPDDSPKRVTLAPTPTSTLAPGATVDERSRPLNYIPEIPSTRSAPPTISEWAHAQRINTQGPNSHPVGCYMKIKREWLKINCEGHYRRIAKMSRSFGMEGHDYYKSEKYDKYVDVILRLRRGHAYKMRIVRAGMPTASLFVNWPGGSRKPNIIALGNFRGDPDGPM